MDRDSQWSGMLNNKPIALRLVVSQPDYDELNL
jgi:hypothetical protein